MVTGGGPYYSTLADMDFDEVRRDITDRVLVTRAVAWRSSDEAGAPSSSWVVRAVAMPASASPSSRR
jgi:hypothetical protein